MRRYSWFLLHPPSFCLRILSGKKSLKPPQSGEFRISSMNDSVVKLWDNTTTLSPIRSQCAIICSSRTIFPPCSMALMSRSLFSARSANEVHQSSFSVSPFLDGILLSATSSGFVSMLLYVPSQVSSCASASSNVRNLAILHLSQIQAGSKCIGGKYMNSEAKSVDLATENWYDYVPNFEGATRGWFWLSTLTHTSSSVDSLKRGESGRDFLLSS